MTLRFLSIGECMIEMAPQPDGSYAMGYAGDTFNTAWYARRAAGSQIDVAYMTAIGDDATSQGLQSFMSRADIQAEVVVREDRTLGLYLITLSGAERSFSYWRDSSAARTLADDLVDLPGVDAGDMIFFSGITLAILPPDGRRTLLDVIARKRALGARVAFDPNLRPKLWQSADDLRLWVTRAAGCSDIVLPSFEDESTMFTDATPAETADRYKTAGASMVVVKNGPDPVLLRGEALCEAIAPTRPARIVDTTAAGDSFNARYLIGLMSDETPVAALRAACDLAGRVIGERGALAPV